MAGTSMKVKESIVALSYADQDGIMPNLLADLVNVALLTLKDVYVPSTLDVPQDSQPKDVASNVE